MTWKFCKISHEQAARGEQRRIQDAFERLFMTSGGPETMALFTRRSAEGGGDDLIVSPSAIGSVCLPPLNEFIWMDRPRPPRTGTALLVGHHKAFGLLKD